jgi:hypothetical protein
MQRSQLLDQDTTRTRIRKKEGKKKEQRKGELKNDVGQAKIKGSRQYIICHRLPLPAVSDIKV